MAVWPPGHSVWSGRIKEWMTANAEFRTYLLAELETRGPLRSRQLEDRAAVASWPSSGWNDGRTTGQMLEFLSARGEIAISGREGNDRLWDLAHRVHPKDPPVLSTEDAIRIRAERRLRVARDRAARGPWPQLHDDRLPGDGQQPVARRRRRRRHSGRGRGRRRQVGRRSQAAAAQVRGPHRDAVSVRQADPRPAPPARPVRIRLRRWRSTFRPRSGAGATTSCRCSMATGSSAGSTPRRTESRQRCACRRSTWKRARAPRTSRRSRASCASSRTGLGLDKVVVQRKVK